MVGQVHMENPSGITINDIHDHTGAKQMEVKEDIGLIVMQDLSNGSSLIISACFLEAWVPNAKCSSEAIKVVYESHYHNYPNYITSITYITSNV